MSEVNGLVTEAQRIPRGSELVAAAASGATTLFVDSAEDFDNAGGDLDVNGIRYVYTSSDIDTDTITLATGLTTAAAVGDSVYVVMGGQIATDHIAFVTMGEGDQAEVLIPYADRTLWPEGVYDNPVPVILSADLATIVEVPARVPVIDGVVFQTATTGERVVIRNDGSSGIAEFWAGDDPSEIPSRINPGLSVGTGVPYIQIKSGTRTGFLDSARIEVASGGTNAGKVTLEASRVVIAGGTAYFGLPAQILNETWVSATIATGFANASGQSVQYMLDAAGNTHIRGAVTIGSASSGDVALTIPTRLRPSDRPAVRTTYTQSLAFAARMEVDNVLGQVRLFWQPGATAVGVGMTFQTM